MSRNWRTLKFKGDRTLIVVTLCLSFTGLLLVFSTTDRLAYKMDRSVYYYASNQAFVYLLGILSILLLQRLRYQKLFKLAPLIYLISVAMLIIVLLFGYTLNDGRRWLRIPVINLTMQPSDISKVALIVTMARLAQLKQGVIHQFSAGALPLLVPIFLSCALIAPMNLGTAIEIGMACFIICYIAGVRLRHFVLSVVVSMGCIWMLMSISKASGFGRGVTWKHRLETFAKYGSAGDAQESYFQVETAERTIAAGKFFGVGPGNGLQKSILPGSFSDYVFSALLEEYGLFGGIVTMALYLLFFWRCILIVRFCPDIFGSFIVLGTGVFITFQAILNMAINLSLLPVCGLALPFVSMGGSSILFYAIALGLTLNVSKQVIIPENASYKLVHSYSSSLLAFIKRLAGLAAVTEDK